MGVASASSRRVAIFGATSDIARATARLYATGGAELALIARDREELGRLKADLEVRGASAIYIHVADFGQIEALEALVSDVWGQLGGCDTALIAYGTLPDQSLTEVNPEALRASLGVNFDSPAVLSALLASRLQQQGHGTLAVITSVAGERGRLSNYTYGAAKGGLQRFLQGLRHRLSGSGVQVVDVRPGLVATKMTEHMKKGALWSEPDRVAKAIVAAIDRGVAVLYVPNFWRLIMFVVRNIPDRLMHLTRL